MSAKTFLWVIALLFATLQLTYAQTASKTDASKTIVGKWSGTYTGDSSGKFELVVNQDNNQKLTGQVIMLTDDGNRHPIDLKTLVWQDGKLSAAYTDPSEGNDVSFTGTYADSGMKGTWQSDGGQSTGTWQVARAPK